MGVRRRRSFNRVFKLRAIRLVLAENRSVNNVASELGVLPKLIYDWVRKFQTDPDEAFPSKGKLPPTDDRLRALEHAHGPGPEDGQRTTAPGARLDLLLRQCSIPDSIIPCWVPPKLGPNRQLL